MNTNNKTLADVKPGGRVRLPDQAERAPWRSMDTCPRDGTVVRLRWGEDHVSPGWWSAPVSPVQNDDGTWPSDTGGFPWAFIDFNNGSAFVNHAVDTEYGPTHWAPYAALSAQPSPGGQGDARALASSLREIAIKISAEHNMAATQWVIRRNDLFAAAALLEALAARQPVGDEERAEIYRNGWEAGNAAQAVDLGQFRRAVRWAVVNAVTEDFKNYAEGLLALIDSHAVGK
ncbi:hypothetical protein A7X84_13850 [Stenotrophomonas maltophilia]|uniref:hypothetical protein n=1 Tax=Stenotrophomonas maltophilia TaxID=40324 RepID=UPI000DA7FEA4|nr:hypothetical protein [Stenotrophomonas maltophilia]PZS80627.1 hypothetical protein A7X84_13850 [Stenotrophomonas maltophilia]PZT13320.1 hypothetical protein A7X82_15190 [Stenotrophomonas maltophilia]